MRQIELNNQLRDILISGAVADALGADIEFMPNPSKDDFLHEVNGTHPLRITDDTQMSLFTAEALLLSVALITNDARTSAQLESKMLRSTAAAVAWNAIDCERRG